MVNIVPVNSRAEISIAANLAHTIWTEHYTPIIGAEQVAYMLDKYQSADAIEDQVEKGIRYYLMMHQERYVGYFSFSAEDQFLFLSKFYVLKSARGGGIGKAAMLFIEGQAGALGLEKIRLTVNKYNSKSITAYEKMGFTNIDSIVQDIGNGFEMDDYVLEKALI